MASVIGTVISVRTMESGAWDSKYQLAEILFNLVGTYAQVDNAELDNLPSLITGSRRNGMVPTIRSVMAGRPATKTTDGTAMTLKTVALSGSGSAAKATFEVAGADWATEITDATAVPTQDRPFSILVAFTEAPPT